MTSQPHLAETIDWLTGKTLSRTLHLADFSGQKPRQRFSSVREIRQFAKECRNSD